jgi:cytosine permease
VLAGGSVGIVLALVGADDLLLPWLTLLGQYVPPLGGVIIADFLFCWRLSVPHMDDMSFAGVRWIGVAGYAVGCVVAALTAGSVLPGVAAPSLLPGMASLNGLLAAATVHVVGYYAVETRGLLPGHDVPDDARRV